MTVISCGEGGLFPFPPRLREGEEGRKGSWVPSLGLGGPVLLLLHTRGVWGSAEARVRLPLRGVCGRSLKTRRLNPAWVLRVIPDRGFRGLWERDSE